MLKTNERFKEWDECLKATDSFLKYLEASPSLAGTQYSRYMIAMSLRFPKLVREVSMKDGLYSKAEQEFSASRINIERSIRYLLYNTLLAHFEEVLGNRRMHITIKQFFSISCRFIYAYPEKLKIQSKE